MPIGMGVIGEKVVAYEKSKLKDSTRVKKGFERIREALVSDAKVASSRSSTLPKDWRNRLYK